MEGQASIGTNAFLTSTESPEVVTSFGNYVVVKLNHNPSFKFISYAYVQETPWSPHLWCDSQLTLGAESSKG